MSNWRGKVFAVVPMSSRLLERLFKQDLALTPVHVFQAIKLDKAKLYVEHTDQSILHIAQKFGYESLSHFSSVFKKRFAKSPIEMRAGSK